MPSSQIRPALSLALAAQAALAASALADLPAVLDRVPADASSFAVLDSLSGSLDDLVALNALAGPDAMDPNIPMLAAMVRGMPGLDAEGSAAILVDLEALAEMQDADPWADDDMAEAAAGPESMALAIVTVSDAALLQRSLGGFAQQGVQILTRDLGGGFAALALSAELLESFEPVEGQMDAHAEKLGAVGHRVSDGAEVLLVSDPGVIGPMLTAGTQDAVFSQAGMMLAMGGVNPGEALGPVLEVMTNWSEQATSGIIGLSYTERGVAVDIASAFEEGSMLHGAMTHTGDAGSMFARLPAGGYYGAVAADTRLPLVQQVFGQVLAGGDDGVMPGLKTAIDNGTGVAFIAPESPAGLLRNSVMLVRTDAPTETAGAFAQAVQSLESPEDAPLIVEGSYEAGATTVEGVEAAGYGVRMRPTPEAQEQMAMMGPLGQFMDPSFFNALLYGDATGFSGYAAPLEDAVLFTMSQNDARLGKALSAAGDAAGLDSDGRVSKALARLPEGSSLVAFVHAEQIEQIAGTLMFQLGFGEAPAPVQPMDPIAIGVAAVDGSTHARVLVPASMLATLMELGAAEDDFGMEEEEERRPSRGLPF